MNSIEKVIQSMDRIEQLAGDESMTPAARMAVSMMIMFRPRLEPFIPQDPAELDEILEKLSQWALAQRSDEVPAT